MFGHPFGYAKFVTLISAICMHESKSGPGWEPQFVSISPLHPQQNASLGFGYRCRCRATDTDTEIQIQLQQIRIQLLRSSNAMRCEANSTECRIQICVFLFDYAHTRARHTKRQLLLSHLQPATPSQPLYCCCPP